MRCTALPAAYLLLIPAIVAASPPDDRNGWPQWRGPDGTGAVADAQPPTEWSDSKNIRWKVEIPGRGHATPVIWKDRIYIQTAVRTERAAKPAEENDGGRADGFEFAPQDRPPREGPPGDRPRRGPRRAAEKPTNVHEYIVMALDRKTGETVWKTVVGAELPHEAGHETASLASGSPVTDGEHIFAHFGSRGLFCLDMDGKVIWDVDLGDMRTRNEFGEGSSPALYKDTLVVQWDHEGDDFIVAFDKATGKERWRKPRDEPTTWSTPVIVEVDGRAQVIASATNAIRAYDLKDGSEIWSCGGMTQNVIPTPIVADGVAYIVSGFRGAGGRAIRLADAKGDVNGTKAIVWSYDSDTPYVPSPVLYGDRLYFLENNKGMLTCLNAKTGEKLYGPQRLDEIRTVYSSIVGAGGNIYIVSRDGVTVVLADGPTFEVRATNKLDDEFNASPAIVGDEMYLRGTKHLYCIAKD